MAKIDLLPELFIAPKGLLTGLLFYRIPTQHPLGAVSENILFIVSLLIMRGLMLSHPRPTANAAF